MTTTLYSSTTYDSTSLVIRDAIPGEAAAIIDLQYRAFEESARRYADQFLPPLTQTVADMIRVFDNHTILVAMQDDILAGSVRASMHGDVCSIERLIVEPSLQGRGIGGALLTAIEARFPQAHRFELHTGHKSELNLRFYETRGYRRVREEPVHATLTIVHMAKEGPASRSCHE